MNTYSRLKKAAAAVGVAAALLVSPAQATPLVNWSIDTDGPGGTAATTGIQFADIQGFAYIQNTVTGGNISFNEAAVFRIPSVNSATNLPGNQLTATFIASGNGTLGGTFNFAPGGQLKVFSDTASNFGTVAGHYGADDGGNQIGSFSLVSGFGLITTTGVPNGLISLAFRADSLSTGYFFDDNGNDLSANVSDGLTFGIVTTNAAQHPPSTTQINEIANSAGGLFFDNFGPGNPYTNQPPADFFVANAGQFRFDVPEPGSLALLGLGLVLAGVTGRRSKQS